jgi:hypothetical protein
MLASEEGLPYGIKFTIKTLLAGKQFTDYRNSITSKKTSFMK